MEEKNFEKILNFTKGNFGNFCLGIFYKFLKLKNLLKFVINKSKVRNLLKNKIFRFWVFWKFLKLF